MPLFCPKDGVHLTELFKNAASSGKQVIVTTHSPRLPRYFEDKSLFVSRREGKETEIVPFQSYGSLFRKGEIEDALEERIARGDFGG